MVHPEIIERILIIWDIKNIDDPTRSSISDYIYHGFGKIDSYLKIVFKKIDAMIKLKVQLEKKGNDNYIGGLHFDFPGILTNFYVGIDENTPNEGLAQVVAELFQQAKNVLQKQSDKLHDTH